MGKLLVESFTIQYYSLPLKKYTMKNKYVWSSLARNNDPCVWQGAYMNHKKGKAEHSQAKQLENGNFIAEEQLTVESSMLS